MYLWTNRIYYYSSKEINDIEEYLESHIMIYSKTIIIDSAFKARVESLSNYIKTNDTWYNSIKALAERKKLKY